MPPHPGPRTAELPGPLVDGDWLAAHLGEVAVLDVRWYLDGRPGRAAWEAGHVPSARWVDLDTEMSAPPGPGTGRHPLPAPAAFVAALARHGVGPSTPVVAYDDASGSVAARLWWMLSTLGRPAAVLDGGLAGWPGPLEAGAGSPPVAVDPGKAPDTWPAAAVAGTEEVAALSGAGRGALLDARAAERHAGAPNPADPRPGHIPGATSAPWAANVDPATGRLLPAAELAARYRALGAGPATVASCGSGVTACHDLLAMAVAGLGPGRLYPGSYSAWASDPARPVELGP